MLWKKYQIYKCIFLRKQMAVKHGNFGKFSKLVSIFSWFIEMAENVTSFLWFASHDISFFFWVYQNNCNFNWNTNSFSNSWMSRFPPKKWNFSFNWVLGRYSSSKGLKPFPILRYLGGIFILSFPKRLPQQISLWVKNCNNPCWVTFTKIRSSHFFFSFEQWNDTIFPLKGLKYLHHFSFLFFESFDSWRYFISVPP